VSEYARNGERFFRMDVRPPSGYAGNWEDRLEAAFNARNR